MTVPNKRHRVSNLRLAEISSVDRPAQTGAISVLIKSAGAPDMSDTEIRKNAAAVAKGEPAKYSRDQYEAALLKRAEELGTAQRITPELALSKYLTTDETLRELTNAYEVANAAQYGATVRRRHAGVAA